ncbi:MAG: cupin-like domain-containing protein [Planctomycetota bacterium]
MSIVSDTRNENVLDIRMGDPIDEVARIDAADFRRNYIRTNRPLKMTEMAKDWPAMTKWSFEMFRDLGSKETVHLEEGNVMQGETSFRKETFADYVSKLIEDDRSVNRGYLSVFRIFDAFPHLRDDVEFNILDQFKLKSSTSGWLGPAGTVTGYHIDWGDNILAQIHGRKRIHLAAPSQSKDMYVSQKFDQGATISEVNMDDYDPDRHPRFRNVIHHEVMLHPGEMVFIPRGWWHHVRSLDPSISVSNITFDAKGIFRDVLPHRIKQKLHDLGLWKCPCTCHVIRDGRWVRK